MTPTDQHLAAQAALYGPRATELARDLPDLGDALAAQLAELSRHPTPDRCERVAITLGGAQRAVLLLREVVMREGAG